MSMDLGNMGYIMYRVLFVVIFLVILIALLTLIIAPTENTSTVITSTENTSTEGGMYSKDSEVHPDQVLIRDALGFKNTDSVTTVTHQSGQFLKVAVRIPIKALDGWGGGDAILKKEGDRYRALYKGQESPGCGLIEKENIPNEVLKLFGYDSCWDDGSGWRVLD